MSTTPIKNSIAVRFPLEDFLTMAGGDWSRRVKSQQKIDPTAEELAEYERAKAALDILNGYEGWMCSDWGLLPPAPSYETVYAETEGEYWARIQAKLDAGEWPDPKPAPLAAINARMASEVARAFDEVTR